MQVLLLARIPWLERATGFDRLSIWHRWNGHACLYLVLAHVVLSVYGYALLDKMPLPDGQSVTDIGKYLVVWKREGGAWRLHIDIWNTNAPAG